MAKDDDEMFGYYSSTKEQVEFSKKLLQFVDEERGDLSPSEVVAIMSRTVGVIILACMDKDPLGVRMAHKNIEIGLVADDLSQSKNRAN
jgi:hypothetical protein